MIQLRYFDFGNRANRCRPKSPVKKGDFTLLVPRRKLREFDLATVSKLFQSFGFPGSQKKEGVSEISLPHRCSPRGRELRPGA
jgi:hypothetical protein